MQGLLDEVPLCRAFCVFPSSANPLLLGLVLELVGRCKQYAHWSDTLYIEYDISSVFTAARLNLHLTICVNRCYACVYNAFKLKCKEE